MSSVADPPPSSAFTPSAAEPRPTALGAEAYLYDLWYLAMPGGRLKPRRLVAMTLLGEPLVFGRDHAGAPFALRDNCPHRGVPLSYGAFDGKEIECCYHGWRFDRDGKCVGIPTLIAGQNFDLSKIRVASYPCREKQGNIWVFMAGRRAPGAGTEAPVADIPTIPGLGERYGTLAVTLRFPCPIDDAVIGLIDPAHVPHVHRSWWWRPAKTAHEKAKRFRPSELGFTMCRHAPSTNSKAYRLLGGAPETEIAFRLPGIRTDHIQSGRHVFCNLTAMTPVGPEETEVNNVLYWTMPWLSPFKPLIRAVARGFLGQDRRILALQQQGLAHHPPLMLVDDADRQAKWYYRLKKEWTSSRQENRPFVNPVKERTLRWRS